MSGTHKSVPFPTFPSFELKADLEITSFGLKEELEITSFGLKEELEIMSFGLKTDLEITAFGPAEGSGGLSCAPEKSGQWTAEFFFCMDSDPSGTALFLF